jgi:hypothetical protein
LTLKQELFVSYYLGAAHGNGTQAARLAGYQGDDNTLSTTAFRLLRNAEIAARIHERVQAVVADNDAILAETWRVASAPISAFMVVTKPATYDEDGTLIEAAQMRLDYASKVRALALLLRYHGMLNGQGQTETPVKALVGVDVSRI